MKALWITRKLLLRIYFIVSMASQLRINRTLLKRISLYTYSNYQVNVISAHALHFQHSWTERESA